MDARQINFLIEKYQNGIASDAEVSQLMQWYRDIGYQDGEYPDADYAVKSRLFRRLPIATLKTSKPTKLWAKISIAAAVVVTLFGTWLFIQENRRSIEGPRSAAGYSSDVTPGKHTATITLANGKTISLKETKNGVIIGDELNYADGTPAASDEVIVLGNQLITASTPTGGTYRFVLPDGSKVWLNATSVLKFPATFRGAKNRTVDLQGEAYFEVTHKSDQPFLVNSSNQTVQVLGTQFNVSSYGDDPFSQTTVIGGLVGVIPSSKNPKSVSVLIKPGFQATVDETVTVNEADIEMVTAWKEEKFVFDDTDLTSIMKQLERWYKVKVDYANIPKNRTFTGVISRDVNLSMVLSKLEFTGSIKFDIDNQQIKIINLK